MTPKNFVSSTTGSFFNIVSFISDSQRALKDGQSALFNFHFSLGSSNPDAILFRNMGKWSLPQRSSCTFHSKIREKQKTGTGAIKRQIPLLIPKREINKYYK